MVLQIKNARKEEHHTTELTWEVIGRGEKRQKRGQRREQKGGNEGVETSPWDKSSGRERKTEAGEGERERRGLQERVVTGFPWSM